MVLVFGGGVGVISLDVKDDGHYIHVEPKTGAKVRALDVTL